MCARSGRRGVGERRVRLLRLGDHCALVHARGGHAAAVAHVLPQSARAALCSALLNTSTYVPKILEKREVSCSEEIRSVRNRSCGARRWCRSTSAPSSSVSADCSAAAPRVLVRRTPSHSLLSDTSKVCAPRVAPSECI